MPRAFRADFSGGIYPFSSGECLTIGKVLSQVSFPDAVGSLWVL